MSSISCTECALHIIKHIFGTQKAHSPFLADESTPDELSNVHGIPTNDYSLQERHLVLIHHLLHGICVNRLGPACYKLSGHNSLMTDLAVEMSQMLMEEAMVGNIHASVFEEVCYTLGFQMPPSTSNNVVDELMKFYKAHLKNLNEAQPPIDIVGCLNEQETMIKSAILIVAGAHRLHSGGSLEDLRSRLFSHICSGSCKTTVGDSIDSKICQDFVDQIPPVHNSDFGLTLLASTVH